MSCIVWIKVEPFFCRVWINVFCPALSGLKHCLVWTEVMPCPVTVLSGLKWCLFFVVSGIVLPCLYKSFAFFPLPRLKFYHILPCSTPMVYLVLPCFTLFYLVLLCSNLFCLVLPCFTLFFLVLPCFTLYFLVLPCSTLLYLVLPCLAPISGLTTATV
jgi:hypothetical protein